jgi:hypothetical protein
MLQDAWGFICSSYTTLAVVVMADVLEVVMVVFMVAFMLVFSLEGDDVCLVNSMCAELFGN